MQFFVTTGFMCLDCLSRWEIGEWTECTKSCNDGEHGVRSREVFCVEDAQGVELEVKDSECKEPKPTTQEACGKQPCSAEWYTEHVGQVSFLYSIMMILIFRTSRFQNSKLVTGQHLRYKKYSS